MSHAKKNAQKKSTLSAPPQMPVKANANRLTPKTDINALLNSQQLKHIKSQQSPLRFIQHYSVDIVAKIDTLLANNQLSQHLLNRYPNIHTIRSDKALYDYAMAFKHAHLVQSAPLAKVVYDDKISLSHHALGLHTYVNRRQGNKIKAKNEIRIASSLRHIPEPLLKMVVVHELAHLKEKQHNKAFYQLCCAMTTDYHQLEFDMRLLLICEDLGQSPYQSMS